MENQNLLNEKPNNEIASFISNRLGGKYEYAWHVGYLGSRRYIELAKRYDLDTAVEEFMDDCDAFLTDDEVSW